MKRRIAWAVVACLVAAPSLAQQPISGSWSGLVLEVPPGDQPETYPVRLRIEAGGTGTIDYPSLACGGTLTPLRTMGEIMEFRERLSYGAENCTDNGTVSVWLKAGRLVWVWTGEETDQPGTVASAVLHPGPPATGERQ